MLKKKSSDICLLKSVIDNLTSYSIECYDFFMLRKFLCILFLFLTLPVFSGELEDAFKTHEKVFVYMYTAECNYCVKFNPIYEKISNLFSSKKCKFLKIDAMTTYGTSVMQSLGVTYVPFVGLLNRENKQINTIVPTCLLDYACAKNATDKFINK